MPSNAKNSGCSGEGISVPRFECLVSFYLRDMNSESEPEFHVKNTLGRDIYLMS